MADLDRAGIIDELETYLLCTNSDAPRFETFAVQILGNMFLHLQYAQKLANHFGLTQCLVKLFSTTKDRELRTEVGITLRNLLSHRNPIVAR